MYQIRLNGRYVFGSPNLNLLNQVKLRYYPSGDITFGGRLVTVVPQVLEFNILTESGFPLINENDINLILE